MICQGSMGFLGCCGSSSARGRNAGENTVLDSCVYYPGVEDNYSPYIRNTVWSCTGGSGNKKGFIMRQHWFLFMCLQSTSQTGPQ